MANMSYCRFGNTLDELRDCFEHMETPISNRDEARARKQLIDLCVKVAGDYDGMFDGKPDAEDDDADAA